MKLKDFNDKAKCCKCGSDSISMIYHNPKEDRSFVSCDDPCYDIKKEHMDRACGRCHYEWVEKVMDKPNANRDVSKE